MRFAALARKWLKWLLVAALAVYLAVAWGGVLLNIASVLLWAVLLALIVYPVVAKLENHMKRGQAIGIAMLGLLAVLAVIVWLAIPQIIEQTGSLMRRMPEYAQAVEEQIGRWDAAFARWNIPLSLQGIWGDVQRDLDARMGSLQVDFLEQAIAVGSAVAGQLVIITTVPIVSCYFLKDREFFCRMLMEWIPAKHRTGLRRTLMDIRRSLGQYVKGKLLSTLIVGIVTAGGLALCGVRFWLLLGIFMALCNLAPYFGPVIGAIPILLSALLDGTQTLLLALLVVVVVQELEGLVLTPRIMGNSVSMHPVFILMSLLAGGMLFGVLGLVLAVPIVLTLRIVVQAIHRSVLAKHQQREAISEQTAQEETTPTAPSSETPKSPQPIA